MIIKAGRRCSYDLDHASSDLYFITNKLLELGEDCKNYRDSILQKLQHNKEKVDKYRKYFDDNNIPSPDWDSRTPF